MNRRLGLIAGCVAGLAVAAAASAQQQTAVSALTSFDFTYRGQTEPGNRHWTSPDGINWTQTYPSGHQVFERVIGSGQINGCAGVVLALTNPAAENMSPDAQTFLPNPGCPQMAILFRPSSTSQWRMLGALFNVTARPAAPQGTVKLEAGSGIFINDDGFVLTNAHVAGSCKTVIVKAYNDRPTSGTIEAVDPKNDLTLIRTHAGYGTPVAFRPPNKPPRLGEDVGVIGYPLPTVLSTEPKATFGQISSVAGMGNDYTLLQISAPIQPGNSGGPVFDQAGDVVGVVVSSASIALLARTGAVPQNVNFAIRGEIAQIFMSAHGVRFHTRAGMRRLDTADIAEAGEKSTAQVLCVKP